ncbi:putative LRR receptor-like serine/threonine-protein kinase [Acorus gramineus]|uniref:non-specific serine/threonine protein kinase n=1 Tax=Acorus gramineus TaxID=55184 RepID=A0AAV9BU49_ACOGR|nr:putative LRR receptor-like serine/threonine-protein kinase [Acorus gramineus]
MDETKLELTNEECAATAKALNSIFQQWSVPQPTNWNISGEICSGAATDTTSYDSNSYNPAIKCTCNQTICHITKLKVYALNVRGVIPQELATLTHLDNLAIGTNNFSGPLPPELGNLVNLQQLYLDSCGASGDIPPTFANLRSLITVFASDNNFTGKLPDFIGSWTNITTLILRNNKISGSIPSNMDKYQQLQLLDLSFNNLTGSIPQSLFNMNSLVYLDLSYNELSGGFPSWANASGLQLNLVANNFVIDSSFAVNCGGKSLTSAENVLYDNETETLGAASYYVTNIKRWAVNNVGIFVNNPNSTYVLNHLNQFTNTLDTELFQSARQSPSSLRYYGLGLENGNYTVSLQFAETEFVDTPTWQSLGRRVFDIYIQGSLMKKDFDIRKEAGSSFKVVEKHFTIPVTNNFLEIHFFWAGKGTCCIPTQGLYGPLISAISVSPDFTPTVSNRPPTTASTKKKSTGLVAGIVVAAVIVCLIILGLLLWRQRVRKLRRAEDEALLGSDIRPHTFSYTELRTGTNDFSASNKLGEGGFGPVYKGKLADGRVVAVKQLSVASHQGKNQFVTEIATISAVQHRNLVKLYGCCIEGDKRILVYEYLENKSLDQALFGKSNLMLDWPTRFEICLGVARGLSYLHEESRVRIVHRDVKASNILLDADLSPKISDFGLAKLYDDKKTHISTRVAGTIGYLAPEYAMRGHLTEKADVFGFGVVALEILSGRPNSDTTLDREQIYLLEWAWQLHENEQDLELVDKSLPDFDKEEALRVLRVSLLCTQASPSLRPPMSRVVAMLSGDIEVGSVISRPGYLTDWRFDDLNTFTSDDASRDYADSGTTSRSATGATNSHQDSTPSTSFTIGAGHSSSDASRQILSQGRSSECGGS